MSNKLLTIAVAVIMLFNLFLLFKLFEKKSDVVFIDTGKLLEKSTDFKLLKQQMEADKSTLKAKLDTLDEEFRSELKNLEKASAKMSVKEKMLSENLLKNKQQQYMQYQQAAEQKLIENERKKSQEILSKVNAVIAEYGEKKGYRMILTTSNGSIAYGDKMVDISEEIIKVLNQK